MPVKQPILVVFAKKAVAGRVKTRLCPPLSAAQAREVAIFLTEKSIENVCMHWPGEIELSVWPDGRDGVFTALVNRYGIKLSTQVDGDLGVKMQAAMARAAGTGQAAVIMGADVPHCPGDIIRSAFRSLESGKNVIGPTADGGYYCIGVSDPEPAMFSGVHWGSALAYEQTLSSCKASGIRFESILPELNDLDTFEDLRELSGQLPELRNFIDEKNNRASQP